MRSNDIKLDENFNILNSIYILKNPFYIIKIGDKYCLFDKNENEQPYIFLELLSENSHIEKIKKGKWIPEKGEFYWFVGDGGEIVSCRNDKVSIDDYRLKNLRCFKTEEEANRYLEIKNYINSKKHDFSLEEWNNENVKKINIYYDIESDYVGIWECNDNPGNETYFISECDCLDIIEKFNKEELLKYYFNIEGEYND